MIKFDTEEFRKKLSRSVEGGTKFRIWTMSYVSRIPLDGLLYSIVGEVMWPVLVKAKND